MLRRYVEGGTAVAVEPYTGGAFFVGKLYGNGMFGANTAKPTEFATAGTGFEAFVCRVKLDGTVAWVVPVSGDGWEHASAIAPDGSGGVFVSGWSHDGSKLQVGECVYIYFASIWCFATKVTILWRILGYIRGVCGQNKCFSHPS